MIDFASLLLPIDSHAFLSTFQAHSSCLMCFERAYIHLTSFERSFSIEKQSFENLAFINIFQMT